MEISAHATDRAGFVAGPGILQARTWDYGVPAGVPRGFNSKVYCKFNLLKPLILATGAKKGPPEKIL